MVPSPARIELNIARLALCVRSPQTTRAARPGHWAAARILPGLLFFETVGALRPTKHKGTKHKSPRKAEERHLPCGGFGELRASYRFEAVRLLLLLLNVLQAVQGDGHQNDDAGDDKLEVGVNTQNG